MESPCCTSRSNVDTPCGPCSMGSYPTNTLVTGERRSGDRPPTCLMGERHPDQGPKSNHRQTHHIDSNADARRVIVRACRAASRSSFVHFGSVLLASASSSSFILCKLLRHSRCIAMAFSPPLFNASQKTRLDSETSAINLDSSEARSAAILRIWPTSSGSL